uniref:Uncharacterized protein n=1 Tax=Cannabis sativa TaxID=3483 RepID=A0A803Q773_CANSA
MLVIENYVQKRILIEVEIKNNENVIKEQVLEEDDVKVVQSTLVDKDDVKVAESNTLVDEDDVQAAIVDEDGVKAAVVDEDAVKVEKLNSLIGTIQENFQEVDKLFNKSKVSRGGISIKTPYKHNKKRKLDTNLDDYNEIEDDFTEE